jgi:hypothetical protein
MRCFLIIPSVVNINIQNEKAEMKLEAQHAAHVRRKQIMAESTCVAKNKTVRASVSGLPIDQLRSIYVKLALGLWTSPDGISCSFHANNTKIRGLSTLTTSGSNLLLTSITIQDASQD